MSVKIEIKEELDISHEENKENIKSECKIEIVNEITSLEALPKFLSTRDNAQNVVYLAEVPEICKTQPCILGVDEAGRGPVLGPMVYGIAYCPKLQEQTLVDLGCADSKQLTEEKRESIFNEMTTQSYANSCVGWAVELISPNVISMNMFKRAKCSLNELSMNSAIGLIQSAADAGANISEVYVDTVGPPEKYQQKLQGIFPQYKITVAKKADSTYPIVSAASICAKVTRDNSLKVWKFREGLDLKAEGFGSGYPGDPVTKRFLSENVDMVFGFPRLVRFSWSTAENALADTAYEMEFDEPDNEKPKYAGQKLTKFFNNTNSDGQPKRTPARFFVQRHLKNCMEF